MIFKKTGGRTQKWKTSGKVDRFGRSLVSCSGCARLSDGQVASGTKDDVFTYLKWRSFITALNPILRIDVSAILGTFSPRWATVQVVGSAAVSLDHSYNQFFE